MFTRPTRGCWLICACAAWQVVAGGDDRPKRVPPRFTIGKETTYFVAPLDKDGYVDYVAAINEHFGRGVTAKNNANVLYWRATGPFSDGIVPPTELFKLLGIDPPPKEGVYFMNLSAFLTKVVKIDAGDPRLTMIQDAYYKHAQVKPWQQGMFPDLGIWLSVNAASLETLVEGTKRPASFSPLFHPRDADVPETLADTILYGVQDRREFGRTLLARAMLHLGEGRLHAAWADLQACHRLARHSARGPWLIESLVGVAIDGVASAGDVTFLKHADITAAQAAGCLADLQALPPMPPLAEKIEVTERALFLDTVQAIARHGRQGLDVLLPALSEDSPPAWLKTLDLTAIDWDEALKTGNRWFDRYAEALRIDDFQKRSKALDELEGKVRELGTDVRAAMPVAPLAADARKTAGQRLGGYIFRLSRSSFPAVLWVEQRGVQLGHNVQIAFALAAHRAATGRYPAKLSELSPRYMKQVPQDAFAGRPLMYSAADQAYVLYSVGPNGKDDGGRDYRDTPEGDDLVVRMPREE
jgi:hypothetical protein